MNPTCEHCGRELVMLDLCDGSHVECCPDCWFTIVFQHNTAERILREREADHA